MDSVRLWGCVYPDARVQGMGVALMPWWGWLLVAMVYAQTIFVASFQGWLVAKGKQDRDDERMASLKEIANSILETAQHSEEAGYERMPFISNLMEYTKAESIGDIPPLCVVGEGLKALTEDALARVDCEDGMRDENE